MAEAGRENSRMATVAETLSACWLFGGKGLGGRGGRLESSPCV